MSFRRDDRAVNFMGVYHHSAPRSVLALPAMAPPPPAPPRPSYTTTSRTRISSILHNYSSTKRSSTLKTTTCMKPDTPLQRPHHHQQAQRLRHNLPPPHRLQAHQAKLSRRCQGYASSTLHPNLVEPLLCVSQFKNLRFLAISLHTPQTATMLPHTQTASIRMAEVWPQRIVHAVNTVFFNDAGCQFLSIDDIYIDLNRETRWPVISSSHYDHGSFFNCELLGLTTTPTHRGAICLRARLHT